MNNDEVFKKFDESLKLSDTENRAAQDRHNDIMSVLRAAGLPITGSYLQGSFGRKTMRAPLKDVDLVVLMDRIQLQNNVTRYLHIAYTAIKARWSSAQLNQTQNSSKAIQLSFAGVKFTVDITIAFEDNSKQVYLVHNDGSPDVKIRSREMGRLVAARNKQTNGDFIHWMRMLKTLKDRPALEELNGIMIESVAYKILDKPMTHEEACRLFLKEAYAYVDISLEDPAHESKLFEGKQHLAQVLRAELFTLSQMRMDTHSDWSQIFTSNKFPSSSSGSVLSRSYLGLPSSGSPYVSPSRPHGK